MDSNDDNVRKDAERYRWLRTHRFSQTTDGVLLDVFDEDNVLLYYSELDDAIDAAMDSSNESL